MVKRVVVFIGVLGVLSISKACVGPGNVFGVVFNDDEPMELSVIEEMGEEGVNYYGAYSYTSHYNQGILVNIDDSPIIEGSYTRGVCFTVDTSLVDLNSIEADSCIFTELEWLVDAGVISMDRVTINEICSVFPNTTKCFYWTRQEMVLPNNEGFNPDGSSWAMDTDCGDFISPDFPPEELNLKSGIIHSEESYRSINSSNISSSSRTNTHLIDIRGRHISGSNGVDVNNLPSTNIILLYNPETGIAKPRALMPED